MDCLCTSAQRICGSTSISSISSLQKKSQNDSSPISLLQKNENANQYRENNNKELLQQLPWWSECLTLYGVSGNFPPASKPSEPFWFYKGINTLMDGSKNSDNDKRNKCYTYPGRDHVIFEIELGIVIGQNKIFLNSNSYNNDLNGKNSIDSTNSTSNKDLKISTRSFIGTTKTNQNNNIITKTSYKNICESNALNFIKGYFIGLDQTDAIGLESYRKLGKPWTRHKGFDTSCPVSQFISKEEIENWKQLEIFGIVESKEGKISKEVIKCNVKDMYFSIEKLISEISSIHTLYDGDMILTCCPVGACKV